MKTVFLIACMLIGCTSTTDAHPPEQKTQQKIKFTNSCNNKIQEGIVIAHYSGMTLVIVGNELWELSEGDAFPRGFSCESVK
jgi:hypothetical protein